MPLVVSPKFGDRNDKGDQHERELVGRRRSFAVSPYSSRPARNFPGVGTLEISAGRKVPPVRWAVKLLALASSRGAKALCGTPHYCSANRPPNCQ